MLYKPRSCYKEKNINQTNHFQTVQSSESFTFYRACHQYRTNNNNTKYNWDWLIFWNNYLCVEDRKMIMNKTKDKLTALVWSSKSQYSPKSLMGLGDWLKAFFFKEMLFPPVFTHSYVTLQPMLSKTTDSESVDSTDASFLHPRGVVWK